MFQLTSKSRQRGVVCFKKEDTHESVYFCSQSHTVLLNVFGSQILLTGRVHRVQFVLFILTIVN